jgi:hypothetical protein
MTATQTGALPPPTGVVNAIDQCIEDVKEIFGSS